MQGRLLVAYSNASNYASTTADYLNSIGRYSGFQVRYAHVTNGAQLDFDLNDFDAVFQSYCVRLPFDDYVSPGYLAQMKSFRGVKLFAAQDEYEFTDKLKAAMRQVGYHVFLTNASKSLIERLYPREQFPQTEFITVLTGYVPEELERRGLWVQPLCDRPTMIGYRVRAISARYGRLGFDKFEIGRRMREICVERGIPHDIEWADDKRIYGDAWFEFLSSCRATLGSETGSNVFDFDGSVTAAYERMAAERGGPVPYEEFRAITDPIEAHYDIGQISPRVFEAAAMRTPMILFPGCYLGMLKPNEHYIELKKDFSNIDAVLSRLDDCAALERMADRAYNHLVGSGAFSYRRFVKLIDATVVRKAGELGLELRPAFHHAAGGETNLDPAKAASMRERPTAAPRDPVYFQYKLSASHNAVQAAEIARLNELISTVQEDLGAELARLNRVYPIEIRRLNEIIVKLNQDYGAEIARLNDVYPAEIRRLQEIIADLHKNHQAEQSRAALVDPAMIRRSSKTRRGRRPLSLWSTASRLSAYRRKWLG